jgi:hypothetical protein
VESEPKSLAVCWTRELYRACHISIWKLPSLSRPNPITEKFLKTN